MKSQRMTFSPEKMKDKTGMGQALAYTAEGDEPAEDLSPEKRIQEGHGDWLREDSIQFLPQVPLLHLAMGILAEEPQEPLCEICSVGDNSDISAYEDGHGPLPRRASHQPSSGSQSRCRHPQGGVHE